MLMHLQVRNFAVVRQLTVDFQAGMTAITGETGAGKSIALDALGLCLGDRAETDSIRAEAEKAEVIASFQVPHKSPAAVWLSENELMDEEEPDHCVLRRLITREGRSKAWINGYPVNVAQLKQLAPLLVNIHGQHEHQLLTRPEHQLELLDAYARHSHLLSEVESAYQQWYQLRKQQKEALQKQEERQSRAQLVRYQVEELDQFALAEGEYTELELQHKRLSNSSALQEDSQFALNALYEGEHNNAYSLVQTALLRLEEQLSIDPQLEPAVKLLGEASVQIEEAARELRLYSDGIEVDSDLLVQVERRVTQAVQLARKHQLDPEQLPKLHQQLSEELAELEAAEAKLADSDEQVQAAAQHYRKVAAKLSKQRQRAAQELGEQISTSMRALNMPHGRFVIAVDHQEQAPATRLGTDSVVFQVTTNPGQPLQALAKVASGGELSRISLAIQVITAAQLTTPTLMFDEVDVGVSGATAATVGKLLRQLGQNNQVICVTHLPQVAAKAHQQLRVDKTTDGESTETQMTALDHDHRVIELARLLGGDTITATTKANAAELLATGS
ncbi:DNA repair protein RecN [Pseudidiomarina sp. 1APP75-32.1]|uniref:DNA repair protein RecN n=1 Tax=Pseudidiomarina terrestris TaxID=2820060 RepID=A0AAW7QXL6_9GAMM|nr:MULTISPECIES: DNA repair protein RecN [unclassified Pseudidiomarina]MDN7123301.1 DNA repair protein RecN [Pseudidiomarina sp. 1APP75-32.1]MDN7127867.1 DNA repair protein RecN [Pseudidiomarina sp. 1APR75-33.1]MDN7128974.1 DNA repair protein RecN [Pseudidiomarina sp. 1APR75-15]MDN7137441.1 DNA repair protein RecN [Pseudidiomarina sp. 1ASP75-14]